MKVLALVDGSDHSLKALDYAINLLRQKNSDSNPYKDKLNPPFGVLFYTTLPHYR